MSRSSEASPPPATDAGGLESAAGVQGAAGRFPCLDGLRALAALAVVMTHVGFQTGASINGPGRSVLSRFDAGVAVFFVLSGFLLHRPQALAALRGLPLPRVTPYLWRRFLRVAPAYWVAVTLALLLVPAARGQSAGEWLRQLAFVSIYSEGHQLPALTQMWSLCTEVTFYLALPFLGRLAARGAPGVRAALHRQVALCAVLYAVAVAWQSVVAGGLIPAHAGYWLPGHVDWFALGMLLAALSAAEQVAPGGGWWSRLAELGDASGTCWLGAGALFVIAGTPLVGPYELSLLAPSESLLRPLLYGLVAVLLVLPAVAGDQQLGVVRALLASRPAVFLGRVSYGVFLLHLVVLERTMSLLGVDVFTGRFWLVTAVAVPASVALAWVSLKAVEEPALRLRDRVPGRAG